MRIFTKSAVGVLTAATMFLGGIGLSPEDKPMTQAVAVLNPSLEVTLEPFTIEKAKDYFESEGYFSRVEQTDVLSLPSADIYYSLNNDGKTADIWGMAAKEESVAVPTAFTVDEKDFLVRNIYSLWNPDTCSPDQTVTSILLDTSSAPKKYYTVNIQEYSFSGFDNLESVSLTNMKADEMPYLNLEVYGYVFDGCDNLSTITTPPSAFFRSRDGLTRFTSSESLSIVVAKPINPRDDNSVSINGGVFNEVNISSASAGAARDDHRIRFGACVIEKISLNGKEPPFSFISCKIKDVEISRRLPLLFPDLTSLAPFDGCDIENVFIADYTKFYENTLPTSSDCHTIFGECWIKNVSMRPVLEDMAWQRSEDGFSLVPHDFFYYEHLACLKELEKTHRYGRGGITANVFGDNTIVERLSFRDGTNYVPGELFDESGVFKIIFPQRADDLIICDYVFVGRNYFYSSDSFLSSMRYEPIEGLELADFSIPEGTKYIGVCFLYCLCIDTLYLPASIDYFGASEDRFVLNKIVFSNPNTKIYDGVSFDPADLFLHGDDDAKISVYAYPNNSAPESVDKYYSYISVEDYVEQTNQEELLHEGKELFDFIPLGSGDMNGDGDISVADLVKMQRYLLSMDTISRLESLLGDVNKDGRVDVFDLVGLRQIIVKLV